MFSVLLAVSSTACVDSVPTDPHQEAELGISPPGTRNYTLAWETYSGPAGFAPPPTAATAVSLTDTAITFSGARIQTVTWPVTRSGDALQVMVSGNQYNIGRLVGQLGSCGSTLDLQLDPLVGVAAPWIGHGHQI